MDVQHWLDAFGGDAGVETSGYLAGDTVSKNGLHLIGTAYVEILTYQLFEKMRLRT